MGDSGSLTRAEEALRLVQENPAEAVRLGTAVSRSSRRQHELGAASVAERAVGLASVHLHDLPGATRHLRRAVELAQLQGSAELAAEARMTLAFALNRYGRPERALDEMGAALADLGPSSRIRGLTQRAAILQQVGRLDEALADYRVAVPGLRRAGDHVWLQRALLNRGVLHAFRLAYGAAARDLHEAQEICARMGLTLPAAFVEENLVLLHRRLGDVPAALEHFHAAQRLYQQLGAPYGSLLLEGSELMLSVGLHGEAREAAEGAVAEFVRTGRQVSVPEARLLLARAAVLDGDPAYGAAQARRAVREFTRQGRLEWAALASCALVLAQAETANARGPSLRRLAEVSARADEAGWAESALDVRLLAARTAHERRLTPQARRLVELASTRRDRGLAASRARAWYALAVLRRDSRDLRGSSAAAARGLQILDEYRATMAATDLRARISALGVELAGLGLANALAGGNPAEVLRWAERGRARHLLQRPTLPPSDPALAQLLAELRSVVAEQAAQHRESGHASHDLVGRQEKLEREIRDVMRRQRGGASSHGEDLDSDTSVSALTRSLGEAALVEFVEAHGNLYAVCLADGHSSLWCLGPMEAVARLVRWLPFALRRLSRHTSGPSTDAAVVLVHSVARDLDGILSAALVEAVGHRPLVLVPTGLLQSLPWSLLPSLAGRPLTVAPSATLWCDVLARAPLPGNVEVVAGPGLPGAEQEAVEISRIHGIRPMLGADASVDAVTGILGRASLLHVAAHGTARADNPLFSSLQLVDGPLTVYDLERLDREADTVVLAACDSGRDVVLAGDEMLGLGAALLSRGSRNVVASVVPIPDAATRPLMVALHRNLADGIPVAQALAQAQSGIDKEDPSAFAAAAGFVCMGAGFAGAAGTIASVER
jgi:tetratricopeptide (TPR) repeat protein